MFLYYCAVTRNSLQRFMASINYTKNMVDLLKEINCNRDKQVYFLITIINYKWLSLSIISFHLFPSKGLSGTIFCFPRFNHGRSGFVLTVNNIAYRNPNVVSKIEKETKHLYKNKFKCLTFSLFLFFVK